MYLVNLRMRTNLANDAFCVFYTHECFCVRARSECIYVLVCVCVGERLFVYLCIHVYGKMFLVYTTSDHLCVYFATQSLCVFFCTPTGFARVCDYAYTHSLRSVCSCVLR